MGLCVRAGMVQKLPSQVNKQDRNQLTDKENKLMVTRWEGLGRMGEKRMGLRFINCWFKNSHEFMTVSVQHKEYSQ